MTADNGTSALAAVAEHDPDLVVLDVMMPGLDGLGVLQQPARRRLAGAGHLPDRARHRQRPDRRAARRRRRLRGQAVQRRGAAGPRARRAAPLGAEAGRDGVLRVADLELDENSHEVTRAGVEVHLTATEFELLRYLMRNERVVLSKAQILDRVWKYDFQGQSNIVELYIGYLRKKIDNVEPKLIHTVRGAGYVIKAPRG